jgi:hypothetical protein
VIAAAAPAPLAGHIAYVQNRAAYVAPAAGGAPVRLPSSGGAYSVSLSPTDGTAVYFTSGVPDASTGARGYVSRPPYTEAKPLPAPFDRGRVASVVWSGDGRVAYLSSQDGSGAQAVFEPATGRLRRLADATFGSEGVGGVSRDGRTAVYVTGKNALAVRRLEANRTVTATERTLFSPASPRPLFAALAKAKRPERMRDLTDTDPTYQRDPDNWVIGKPALMPDGKTAFFATNGGQGMGAAGNTQFGFFAADLSTGGLAALSKLGTFFGRVPHECLVSPDGKRMLFLSSVHNMAIDNPTGVFVVDLPTQAYRLLTEPGRRDDTNLIDGVCWSPDGRYIAVSATYYNVEAALKASRASDTFSEPRPSDYVLFIKDAATGRTVRRIPGAIRPSWSR